MKKQIITNVHKPILSIEDIKIGDIFQYTNHNGNIRNIMKTYEGYVSLDNPTDTWNTDSLAFNNGITAIAKAVTITIEY